MNNYPTVNSKGGNQYEVIIGEESRIVDLDGYTIMNDEDYCELEDSELVEDNMLCPSMWNVTGDNDVFFRAALDFTANYSGFDAQEFIKNNKK